MSPRLKFPTVPLSCVPRGIDFAGEGDHRLIVLVVDGEVMVADTRAAILTNWGCTVMTAYDAESALEMAALIPPEILISDMFLMKMNGVDLATAIRTRTPDCKVLLFSGRADSLDLLSTAENAGHSFTMLQKPVHPVQLLEFLPEIKQRNARRPSVEIA